MKFVPIHRPNLGQVDGKTAVSTITKSADAQAASPFRTMVGASLVSGSP